MQFHVNDLCSMFHIVCLLGLQTFDGQNENQFGEPSIKSPSSLNLFFSVSSISSTIKDILFKKSTDFKKAGCKNFHVRTE